jgi:hypothetical protein
MFSYTGFAVTWCLMPYVWFRMTTELLNSDGFGELDMYCLHFGAKILI